MNEPFRWFFVTVILVVGLVVLWGMSAWRGQQTTDSQSGAVAQQLLQVPDRSSARIKVGDTELIVEVVNTPASITQGLSGRAEIGADGMLFVFPNKTHTGFWMKEMQFDLDMIWLADDTVVAITERVPRPSPGTPLSELPTYHAGQSSDMVLELPSGKASEMNMTIGTKISITE